MREIINEEELFSTEFDKQLSLENLSLKSIKDKFNIATSDKVINCITCVSYNTGIPKSKCFTYARNQLKR